MIDDVLSKTPDAEKLAGVIVGEDIDQPLGALGGFRFQAHVGTQDGQCCRYLFERGVRDRRGIHIGVEAQYIVGDTVVLEFALTWVCLLYTSDAADE